MSSKEIFMGIPIAEDSSPKEIGSAIYDLYKQNDYWKASYNYKRKEPKQFFSKKLPDELRKNFDFAKNSYYVAFLYNNGSRETVNLPELARSEYNKYNWDQSIICVYCSVLFYLLMKKENAETGALKDRKMKYVQGFYRHPLRKEIPDMLAPIYGGRIQIGSHAFIAIDDMVFDFTIGQQTYAFDIDQSYVQGEIPKGLEYFGYEESLTLVNQYWEYFAKEAGMHKDLWLLQHRIDMLEMVAKDMEKYL